MSNQNGRLSPRPRRLARKHRTAASPELKFCRMLENRNPAGASLSVAATRKWRATTDIARMTSFRGIACFSPERTLPRSVAAPPSPPILTIDRRRTAKTRRWRQSPEPHKSSRLLAGAGKQKNEYPARASSMAVLGRCWLGEALLLPKGLEVSPTHRLSPKPPRTRLILSLIIVLQCAQLPSLFSPIDPFSFGVEYA